MRDGRCKPLYQAPIDKAEAYAKREAEAAKLQAAGREAPDFTLNDLKGQPLSLSSLRGKVLSDYGVQGFPTKIIIGPDGKIVKTIVGEDPAFYTFLDELFAN